MISTFLLSATLFFAGDSTLDDHGFKYPYRSWGRETEALLKPGNVISNFAQSGASTKSFATTGRWTKLITAVKAGDFVRIEFGHNDQAVERRLKAAPSAPWSARARELLAVPKDVMVSMTEYTYDPAKLYAWRNAIADLIEESDVK